MSETEPVLRRLITLIFAGWLPPDLVSSRSCLVSAYREFGQRPYQSGSPRVLLAVVASLVLLWNVWLIIHTFLMFHFIRWALCTMLTLQKFPPHWQWPTWMHKVLGRWLLWLIDSLSPSPIVVCIGCISEAGLSMIWHKYRAASLPAACAVLG